MGIYSLPTRKHHTRTKPLKTIFSSLPIQHFQFEQTHETTSFQWLQLRIISPKTQHLSTETAFHYFRKSNQRWGQFFGSKSGAEYSGGSQSFLHEATSHSMPSCRPSPVLALQAWICQMRSWIPSKPRRGWPQMKGKWSLGKEWMLLISSVRFGKFG